MRTAIIQCKHRYQAYQEAPWASFVVKVEGGYKCFESETDYKIWKNQK